MNTAILGLLIGVAGAQPQGVVSTIEVITAYLPDPVRTPGAVDPTKTAAIICAKGYATKNVRPPASYTDDVKLQQMKKWNLLGQPSDYEEDHLVSLELGGSPTNTLNLWPQSWTGKWNAHMKDKLENFLHKQVCLGKIKLCKAQEMIASDWISAYKQFFGDPYAP